MVVGQVLEAQTLNGPASDAPCSACAGYIRYEDAHQHATHIVTSPLRLGQAAPFAS